MARARYTPHHAAYWANRLLAAGEEEDAVLRTVAESPIEPMSHQVTGAVRALASPSPGGYVIADEFGLGKTVAACIVMQREIAEGARRILVIAPSSVTAHWKFELKRVRIEAKVIKRLEDAIVSGRPPFRKVRGTDIVTPQFARRHVDAIANADWDLVVFDEAHWLRNARDGVDAGAVRDALSDTFKLLLTAYPMHNSEGEPARLLALVDGAGQGGSAQSQSGRGSGAGASIGERAGKVMIRHLRQDIKKAGYMHLAGRKVKTVTFEPTGAETALHDRLAEYLRGPTLAFEGGADPLMRMLARRQLASSPPAVTAFLETVITRLKEGRVVAPADLREEPETEPVDEAEVGAGNRQETQGGAGPAADEAARKAEIKLVEGFLAEAKAIGRDGKLETLLRTLPGLLDAVVKTGGERRAVVFVESRQTQDYLCRRLAAVPGYRGKVLKLNADNARTINAREGVLKKFGAGGTRILVSTASGENGLNMPFCSLVVNYDLTWNPQRIDQRIGRCQRYPQQNDVTVVNLVNAANAAEHRAYELLWNKFALFSETFGASDEIVGSRISWTRLEIEIADIILRHGSSKPVRRWPRELEEGPPRAGPEAVLPGGRGIRRQQARIRTWLMRRAAATMVILRVMRPIRMSAGSRHRFTLRNPVTGITTAYNLLWQEAAERGGKLLTLAPGSLARRALEEARFGASEPVLMRFSLRNAQGVDGLNASDLAAIDRLKSRKGWLEVRTLGSEQSPAGMEIVVVAVDDRGRRIEAGIIDVLLLLPATLDVLPSPWPEADMAQRVEAGMRAARGRMTARAKGSRRVRRAEMRVAEVPGLVAARLARVKLTAKRVARRRKEFANADGDRPERREKIRAAVIADLRASMKLCALTLDQVRRRRFTHKRLKDEEGTVSPVKPRAKSVMRVRWELRG